MRLRVHRCSSVAGSARLSRQCARSGCEAPSAAAQALVRCTHRCCVLRQLAGENGYGGWSRGVRIADVGVALHQVGSSQTASESFAANNKSWSVQVLDGTTLAFMQEMSAVRRRPSSCSATLRFASVRCGVCGSTRACTNTQRSISTLMPSNCAGECEIRPIGRKCLCTRPRADVGSSRCLQLDRPSTTDSLDHIAHRSRHVYFRRQGMRCAPLGIRALFRCSRASRRCTLAIVVGGYSAGPARTRTSTRTHVCNLQAPVLAVQGMCGCRAGAGLCSAGVGCDGRSGHE